jgi:Transglycosylase SLT domain
MPQFRSIPSFDWFDDEDDEDDERSMTEGLSASFPSISPSATSTNTVRPTNINAYGGQTSPLFPMTGQHPVINTERLTAIAARTGGLEIETPAAPSLIAALQATIPSNTTGRLTVIPAEMKRPRATVKQRQTEKLPATGPRMGSRMRQIIIITSIFTVLMITLVSLAPLDNGQSTFHVFSGISNWVRNGQLVWFLESQHQQVAQKQGTTTNTQQNNAPVPPPMNLPTSQYVAIAQQDAINVGISPVYFVRQINLESGFNPNAVSPAGAVGIAQFLPSTAAGLGINPRDPIQALRGAANLMASYNRQYGGNYAMALAAYNGGGGTVQYAINTCGSGNWMNCLPAETRHYIYVIMGI